MRIVVYGVGAIGGVIAGALTLAGQECVGIARGRRLSAIRETGLLLRTVEGSHRLSLKCVASPADIAWRGDDAIVIAMKSQDTAAALEALRAVGVDGQPIFCAQNGIANEREALRYFPNVHAINVMMPAEYMAADEAVAHGTPNYGIFDIGRYPSGTTDEDEALAAALTEARIAGFVAADVMRNKYGKLLLNLGNIVEAAMGRGADRNDIAEALREEGRAVLIAAGIEWNDVGSSDPRREELMRLGEVDGAGRSGSSSAQSLARESGSIETDFLNGEIVLLGRLHGVPVPLNAAAARFGARLARGRRQPGSVSREEISAALGRRF